MNDTYVQEHLLFRHTHCDLAGLLDVRWGLVRCGSSLADPNLQREFCDASSGPVAA